MEEEEEVKLLGAWPSPFVLRVRIALNIKSVKYYFLDQSILKPKSQLLLESNPVYKKIPVLIHNNKPIVESLIIVQYIDEFWKSGPSILPSHPYDRAIARFWAAYVEEKIFPSIIEILCSQEEEAKKSIIDKMVEAIAKLEEAYLKLSKQGTKPFFGGDKIGFLDITFGSILCWIQVIEKYIGLKLIDETITPGLAKWAQDFSADSNVKDLIPDIKQLEEFTKGFQAMLLRGEISK